MQSKSLLFTLLSQLLLPHIVGFQFFHFFFVVNEPTSRHGKNSNEDCGEGPLVTPNSFCTFVKIFFIVNVSRLTVNAVNFYFIDHAFFLVEREIFHLYVATIIMCVKFRDYENRK